MEIKNELEVGKKVYLKPINNAARYGNNTIKEEVILKIGRKYLFVGKDGEQNERLMTKFSIEDLKEVSNYSPDWVLYFNKQQILDEEEANGLTKEIKNKFNAWGKVDLTLDQLRRIKAIIDED